jgi:hypothetical protein
MSSADASPGDAARHELELRQRSLVAALIDSAEPPAGIDPARIQAQARALVAKRARVVARAEPELAVALGEDFLPAFRAYASSQSGEPGHGGAEARAFARYLLGPGRARWREADHAREVRGVASRVAGRRLRWK